MVFCKNNTVQQNYKRSGKDFKGIALSWPARIKTKSKTGDEFGSNKELESIYFT